jgi:hypothetical protein
LKSEIRAVWWGVVTPSVTTLKLQGANVSAAALIMAREKQRQCRTLGKGSSGGLKSIRTNKGSRSLGPVCKRPYLYLDNRQLWRTLRRLRKLFYRVTTETSSKVGLRRIVLCLLSVGSSGNPQHSTKWGKISAWAW